MNHEKLYLVGKNALFEAFAKNLPIQKIFLVKGLNKELAQHIRREARARNCPISIVPKQKLDGLTRARHQGIVALKNPIRTVALEDVVAHAFEQGEDPLILMLDGVSDVRNFGAIARSAEVFGAHGIVMMTVGSAQINEFAIKASAGAILRLPVIRENKRSAVILKCRSLGLKIAVASEKANLDIESDQYRCPVMIVLGDESKGVSNEILDAADFALRIPQKGKIQSLNVSVAAGILLYEWTRNR